MVPMATNGAIIVIGVNGGTPMGNMAPMAPIAPSATIVTMVTMMIHRQ
jgi:hypothetical protein